MAKLAVVAIGRNEGERLARCLDSLQGLELPVVYVDSGSSDGSVALARGRGATVVELDGSRPFTAGRGRNEGLEKARTLYPDLELVQFVDGDCEIFPGWMERGRKELESSPHLAAVCGRVRELNRERTIYNRLCDLEWDAPPGETDHCGGNMMMRVSAFLEAGGFNPALIAGEEPDLCVRLRRAGWKLWRCDCDMVHHDAAMTRFSQWWRRSMRAGWAFAEGAALHGSSPERHWVRQNRSALFWGVLLPLAALLPAWPTRGASLLLLTAHLLQMVRIYRNSVRSGVAARDARLQAAFLVLGKFPEAMGRAQFTVMRALGKRRRVVDWRTTG
jgi:GT2 family glycosyltransferase